MKRWSKKQCVAAWEHMEDLSRHNHETACEVLRLQEENEALRAELEQHRP